MYELFAKQIEKYSPDMVLSDFYYDNGKELSNSEQLFDREYYNKEDLKNSFILKCFSAELTINSV